MNAETETGKEWQTSEFSHSVGVPRREKKCGVADSVIITLSVFHDNRTGCALCSGEKEQNSLSQSNTGQTGQSCERTGRLNMVANEAWVDSFYFQFSSEKVDSVKRHVDLEFLNEAVMCCTHQVPLNLSVMNPLLETWSNQWWNQGSESPRTAPALRLVPVATPCPSWRRQRPWLILGLLPVYRRDKRPSVLTLKSKSGVSILLLYQERTQHPPMPHKAMKAIIFTAHSNYNITITLFYDLNNIVLQDKWPSLTTTILINAHSYSKLRYLTLLLPSRSDCSESTHLCNCANITIKSGLQ